jgi:AAA+ superfamily predicted ATPase
MTASDEVLASLAAAVEARPEDGALRLHLAQQLLEAGRVADALGHCTRLVGENPGDPAVLSLLSQITASLSDAAQPAAAPEPPAPAAAAPAEPPAPEPVAGAPAGDGFDWGKAESELGDVDHPFAEPAFADDGPADDALSSFDVDSPRVRLADVAGMSEVKERLELAFLAPLRNPELRTAFSKSLRGGLLLYGPPGCGKTFLARALAGELGVRLISVSLADVLDMYIGNSERNIAQLFKQVRRAAPVVLFLDEIDALGQKRTNLRGSAMRGAVNQLLTELDGLGGDNEGVFVLAATNHPWDVDTALRRPGRLDRMLLVLPPDAAARDAVLRAELAERPVTGIDVRSVVAATDGFSGADLVHLVEVAAERALIDSARRGSIRPIDNGDLKKALKEVRASTGAWFAVARNVAQFGNESGEYDELLDYLRRTKQL